MTQTLGRPYTFLKSRQGIICREWKHRYVKTIENRGEKREIRRTTQCGQANRYSRCRSSSRPTDVYPTQPNCDDDGFKTGMNVETFAYSLELCPNSGLRKAE